MQIDFIYLLIGLGVFAVACFSAIAYLEKNYNNKKTDV